MESGSEEVETKPKKKPGRKMMMTEPANVLVLSSYHPLTGDRNVKLKTGPPNERSGNVRKFTLKVSRIESPNSSSLRKQKMLRMPC
jgi:hypothetical protein